MQLRCSGMLNNFTHFPQNVPIKKLWKSVNIWRRSERKFDAYFLTHRVHAVDWLSLDGGIAAICFVCVGLCKFHLQLWKNLIRCLARPLSKIPVWGVLLRVSGKWKAVLVVCDPVALRWSQAFFEFWRHTQRASWGSWVSSRATLPAPVECCPAAPTAAHGGRCRSCP